MPGGRAIIPPGTCRMNPVGGDGEARRGEKEKRFELKIGVVN